MKEKSFIYNAASIVDPLEVQRIDPQLAARRAKLMKDLRERIAEVERRVAQFNSRRAALWGQVERLSTRGCWLGWARENEASHLIDPDDVSLSPNSCRKISVLGPVDVCHEELVQCSKGAEQSRLIR